jgi:hypothetical protein
LQPKSSKPLPRTKSASDNRHVNHIPPIAQHFMLLEALKTGLTEERIAAALDISLERAPHRGLSRRPGRL